MFKKIILLVAAPAVVLPLFLLAYRFEAPPVPTPMTTEADEVETPTASPVPLPAETTPESISEPVHKSVDPEVSVPAEYPEKIIAGRQFTVDGQDYPIRSYKTLATVNDPYANQWWLAQTDISSAWDKSTGSGATIAVIDTGFALDHEEFSGRWLTNTGESGPTIQEGIAPNCTSRGLALDKSCNGIDDDGNGFIDDYSGWDFVGNHASVQAGEETPGSSDAFHGTAVTGIAAATGNNSKGIAGVSWGAKILPLQALNDEGVGDTLSIARAIRYAADRNVDVINLSLGGVAADTYLRQSIQYALDRDTIVVAAAGNDGCDCMVYPAAYPEVLAVGAYGSNGERTSFSSYGSSLDILAPGAGMSAPSWSASNATSAYANNIAGTSFSAPYVSGLLANARTAQPSASWGQLVALLLQTTDHRDRTTSQPHSIHAGFGYSRAGSYFNRLTGSLQLSGRYYLHVPVTDLYGSSQVHDCQTSDFPAVPMYVITENSVLSYSVSELAAARSRAKGASVTLRGYVCMGLASDKAEFSRLLEPLREFSNGL